MFPDNIIRLRFAPSPIPSPKQYFKQHRHQQNLKKKRKQTSSSKHKLINKNIMSEKRNKTSCKQITLYINVAPDPQNNNFFFHRFVIFHSLGN